MKLKKILSSIFVLTMILSMTLTAFADNEGESLVGFDGYITADDDIDNLVLNGERTDPIQGFTVSFSNFGKITDHFTLELYHDSELLSTTTAKDKRINNSEDKPGDGMSVSIVWIGDDSVVSSSWATSLNNDVVWTADKLPNKMKIDLDGRKQEFEITDILSENLLQNMHTYNLKLTGVEALHDWDKQKDEKTIYADTVQLNIADSKGKMQHLNNSMVAKVYSDDLLLATTTATEKWFEEQDGIGTTVTVKFGGPDNFSGSWATTLNSEITSWSAEKLPTKVVVETDGIKRGFKISEDEASITLFSLDAFANFDIFKSITTTTDGGYYADAIDSDSKNYTVVFNSFYDGDMNKNGWFYGMFVYVPTTEGDAKGKNYRFDGVKDGKFNVMIDEISGADADEYLVAIPYISDGTAIKKQGSAASVKASDFTKWLGAAIED